MTYRILQLFTILLPTMLIGGFEYIRHELLMPYMSMETGNLLITLLTFVLSFLFSLVVFKTIRKMNDRLVAERSHRAVYEERERLARELHDGMAQTLFYLNITIKRNQLDEAREAVAALDNHVRQAIFNLRTLPEEGTTLRNRLEIWLAQWSTLTGLGVSSRFDMPDSLFTPREEIQLFAIIQEAFTNIRKHAQANRVSLQIDEGPTPGSWQLTIEDDGIGIIDTVPQPGHYGLKMMQERAAEIRAAFSITRHERGTRLTLVSNGTGGNRK
ncbi:sensor histidine kinase [Brevibacillus fluminis]|uniref:sensor histidine kinase n=1 Tax=Brevibacillus fluminis TaxID=511487 RepID=UPI003F8C90A5